MPRPSLKAVRSTEILEAFITCVSRYGLEGATQERIAQQAGVKRSILRHYLGNRDDMIDALIDHLAADFDGQTEALRRALPAKGRIDALLALLFGGQASAPTDRILAFEAIVAAAERLPKARAAMLASVSSFVHLVEDELKTAYPRASADEVSAAAFGLVSLSFNLDSLAPLQPPDAWRESSRRAAESLVADLGEIRDD